MPQRNNTNSRAAGRYVQSRYFNQKYDNSFFPIIFKILVQTWSKHWNDFDIISFKDKLKCTFKPRRQKDFNCGEKLAKSLLCRMRIGRSYLKVMVLPLIYQVATDVCEEPLTTTNIFYFSKHWPSGPMLSISRNVHMFVCVSVCLSVCLSVCSLLRYRLTLFLPPLPKVRCPIILEIRNPWGKVMERSGLTFEHFLWKWSKIAAQKKVFFCWFLPYKTW